LLNPNGLSSYKHLQLVDELATALFSA